MAIRTTTTRTTITEREPSADQYVRLHADFSFEELVQAYFDCRKHKRNTATALAFEHNLERNLNELNDELVNGTYAPGKSICFVITKPKAREVWAADFKDRIVHHLFYNRISPSFYASFIADSCACIPERGTLYAAKRLESKIRSASQNWSKNTFYLKCDLANFFVSIDKKIVYAEIQKKVTNRWWLWLARKIIFHDPRLNYELRGDSSKIDLVPPHKRLGNQVNGFGLPIGNLSSQFFANIYLNVLDQHIKHRVGAKHYVRYVDDFIILHDSPQWLNSALKDITAFLPARLHAELNPNKTILQPVSRGVDFVGHVIKPYCRSTRKRTINGAINRIRTVRESQFFEVANSYFGLIGQASSSHHDRALLANAVRDRGYTVNRALTKTYRKAKNVQH